MDGPDFAAFVFMEGFGLIQTFKNEQKFRLAGEF